MYCYCCCFFNTDCISDVFRVELEAKLQELERRRIEDESRLHADREKMAERVQVAQEAREIAEKEAIVLKFVN